MNGWGTGALNPYRGYGKCGLGGMRHPRWCKFHFEAYPEHPDDLTQAHREAFWQIMWPKKKILPLLDIWSTAEEDLLRIAEEVYSFVDEENKASGEDFEEYVREAMQYRCPDIFFQDVLSCGKISKYDILDAIMMHASLGNLQKFMSLQNKSLLSFMGRDEIEGWILEYDHSEHEDNAKNYFVKFLKKQLPKKRKKKRRKIK